MEKMNEPDKMKKTMDFLDQSLGRHQHRESISFEKFLTKLTENPSHEL